MYFTAHLTYSQSETRKVLQNWLIVSLIASKTRTSTCWSRNSRDKFSITECYQSTKNF